MARPITILMTLGLAAAAVAWTPDPKSGLLGPDGLAVTPLWMRMESGGSICLRDQEVGPGAASALSVADAMEQSYQAIPKSDSERLAARMTHPSQEHLVPGWLRVSAAPDTPFSEVWKLFWGPDKLHSIYKYAFEFPGGKQRVFVRMPWDFGVICGPYLEPRRMWVIQWLDRGEYGFDYEGVRHALGTDMGYGQLAIDSYHATAEEAQSACANELSPGLLVEPDVPWFEVVQALEARATNGATWWPVPVDNPHYAEETWYHEPWLEADLLAR